MNKVILNSGGHPLIIEDLQHMVNAYSQAFEGLLLSFYDSGNYPNHAIVLSGCELTFVGGTTINVSAGFAALQGEIFNVPAHSLTFSGFYRKNDLQFELIETSSGLQPVTYDSGATHISRFNRVLQIYHTSNGSTSSVTSNGVFWGIKEALATLKAEWSYIAADPVNYGVTADVSFNGGNVVYENTLAPWRVKVNADGLVLLQGAFNVQNLPAGGGTLIHIFTLPLNMRPAQNIRKVYDNGYILIDNAGKVSIYTAVNASFQFDNMVFTND